MTKGDSPYSCSVCIPMLVKVLKNVMNMNIFLGNTISKLCDATRDALAERLQSLHDTGYLFVISKDQRDIGKWT